MADDTRKLILIVRVFFDEIRFGLLLFLIIIERVRVEVESSWELMLICDLFVDEGIHIEVDSLQVEDQVLRGFADPCLL